MSESDFPTTILTSKSPEEVANFLPHSLQLSSKLLEKNLLVWFANYAAMVARYNQDLNTLVVNGRSFFAGSGEEFGSLDKIWNCVASSVMSQIQVNEALIKVIKKDVLGQFSGAFKDDFKFSELLVNSEELLEMKNHLEDANGAYNWNVKAPAILGNFENYKRFEKELIFNAFISYFNALNSKSASMVSKNENAVNFILKEYHIDNEMQLYTDYVINTNPPKTERKDILVPLPEASIPRPQLVRVPSGVSVDSGSTSGGTPVKEKRKSKLRLKVGSILGRKKKNTTFNQADTIPEDASTASGVSRLGTFVSQSEHRGSLQTAALVRPQGTVPERKTEPVLEPKIEPKAEPKVEPKVEPKYDTNREVLPAESVRESVADSVAPSGYKKPQTLPTFDSAPLQPYTAPQPKAEVAEPEVPPKALQAAVPPSENLDNDREDEVPNFVKYSSSEDESDIPVATNGRRVSLLDSHGLGQPPKVEAESDVRSRNTSSGKYSFEYGDETKSISTPQHTPRIGTAPQAESFNDQQVPVVPETLRDVAPRGTDLPAVPTQTNDTHQPLTSVRLPPPPPPSRKAHPAAQEIRKDGFQNLHSARESFIQPQGTGMTHLLSQTTGNSLMKQDHFKHFGPTETAIGEGLNTSIAEIINTTFKDGRLAKVQVLGEIAFNYNSSEPSDTLTVNIPTQFSKYLLNDLLMSKHGNEKYTLNLAQIANKTLGGVKYLLDLDASHVPILLKQIWKFEPQQASLIIKLSLNPAYSQSVTLENFSVSASLDNSVASISASSKPEGSFNKDLNRLTWRYVEPLVFNSASPEIKLIARIKTTGTARESSAGTRLRFTISEGAVPNVTILDASRKPVPYIASLSSGNYSSHV